MRRRGGAAGPVPWPLHCLGAAAEGNHDQAHTTAAGAAAPNSGRRRRADAGTDAVRRPCGQEMPAVGRHLERFGTARTPGRSRSLGGDTFRHDIRPKTRCEHASPILASVAAAAGLRSRDYSARPLVDARAGGAETVRIAANPRHCWARLRTGREDTIINMGGNLAPAARHGSSRVKVATWNRSPRGPRAANRSGYATAPPRTLSGARGSQAQGPSRPRAAGPRGPGAPS